jgi:hypothetical protein
MMPMINHGYKPQSKRLCFIYNPATSQMPFRVLRFGDNSTCALMNLDYSLRVNYPATVRWQGQASLRSFSASVINKEREAWLGASLRHEERRLNSFLVILLSANHTRYF